MRNIPLARRRYLEREQAKIQVEKRKKKIQDFASYLDGKKVILVGPAGYLQGKEKGEWIDTFDVVIRMNLALPIARPKDYGHKTNILYTFATRLWAKHWVDCSHLKGLDWVVITTGKELYIRNFKRALPGGVQMRNLSDSFYKDITKKVISTPNTGTTAIIDLLRFDINNLTVTGFDYYASGYYQGYGGDGDPGNHIFRNQLAYISLLEKQENRLRLDEGLKGAIDNALTIRDKDPCDKDFSLLIPYKKKDEHGHKVFKWLISRYERMFPNAEICIGASEPFNRAKAINNAAKIATKDKFIITDADALFSTQLVDHAFDAFKKNCVKVKNVVCDVSADSTVELLESNDLDIHMDVTRIRPANFFSLISREQFNGVGGFDEGFIEWGGEDNAFYKVLSLTYGEFSYCTGKIFHLWHPESLGSKNFKRSASRKRWNKYVKAKTLEEIKRIICAK